MKFFLAQEIRRILLISLLLLKVGRAIFLVLLFKMALPPLHFWFAQVIAGLRWQQLILFLSVFKIPPIWFFLPFTGSKLLLFLIFTNILMIINYRIKYLFFISSGRNSYWFLILASFNIKLSINYFLVYLLILLFTLFSIRGNIEFYFPLFVFMGLPPLPLFFLKWLFLRRVVIYPIFFILVFIIFIFSLLSYFRVGLLFLNMSKGVFYRSKTLPVLFLPLIPWCLLLFSGALKFAKLWFNPLYSWIIFNIRFLSFYFW